MLLVVTPEGQAAAEVWRCLVSWSRSGILHPLTWLEVGADPIDAEPEVVQLIAGREERSRLGLAAAGLERDGPRADLIGLWVRATDDEDADAEARWFVQRMEEVRRQLGRVLPAAALADLHTVMVAAPDRAETSVPGRLFAAAWSANVVVGAEDRQHPTASNVLESVDGVGPAHAAHAVATLTDLWSDLPMRRRATLEHLVAIDAPASEPLVVARAYTRLLDAGYLPDQIASAVFLPRDGWPNPDVRRFDRGEVAARVPGLVDDYFAAHATVLGPTTFTPPEPEPEPRLGLFSAILAALRWLVAVFVEGAANILEGIAAKVHDRVARAVEDATPGSGILVERWFERPAPRAGDPSAPRRDFVVPPGPVADAWRDLRRLVVCLIDGTPAPEWVVPGTLDAQDDKRLLALDPGEVVPPRAGSGAAACDPRGSRGPKPADEAERARSLLWTIGARLSTTIDSLESSLPDLQEQAEQAAAVVADDGRLGSPRIDELIRSIVRRLRRAARMATIVAVVAAAALILLTSGLVLFVGLVAVPVLWAVTAIVAAVRSRKRKDDLRQEVEVAHLDASVAAIRLALAEGDLPRLRQRYEELVDWAGILTELTRRPWSECSDQPTAAMAPIDPETLPSAFTVATGVVGPGKLAAMVDRASADVFRPSWLDEAIGRVVDGAMIDLLLSQGHLDAADPAVAKPDPFEDVGEDPEGPRRAVLEAVAAGRHRQIDQVDDPKNVRALIQTSDLDLLLDGVAPIGHLGRSRLDASAPEPVAPTVDWFRPPSGLDELNRALRPSVVRVHTADGSGTGVLVRDDGTVATNRHVVEGADVARVVLDDGSEHDAEVVAVSSTTDLALVRAAGIEGVRRVAISDEEPVQGQQVVTLGHPAMLEGEHTLAWGVVTAVRRTIHLAGHPDWGPISVIGADYPGTGGSSGSPVFDLHGRLVAIHCAGDVSETADHPRGAYLSFAVPVRDLLPLLDGLAVGAPGSPGGPGTPGVPASTPGVPAEPVAGFFTPLLGEGAGGFDPVLWRRDLHRSHAAVQRSIIEPAGTEAPGPHLSIAFGRPCRSMLHRIEVTRPCAPGSLRSIVVPDDEG